MTKYGKNPQKTIKNKPGIHNKKMKHDEQNNQTGLNVKSPIRQPMKKKNLSLLCLSNCKNTDDI